MHYLMLKRELLRKDLMVLIKFLWLWLQTSIHKAFLREEEEEITTREGEVLVDMDLTLVE